MDVCSYAERHGNGREHPQDVVAVHDGANDDDDDDDDETATTSVPDANKDPLYQSMESVFAPIGEGTIRRPRSPL